MQNSDVYTFFGYVFLILAGLTTVMAFGSIHTQTWVLWVPAATACWICSFILAHLNEKELKKEGWYS